MSVDFHSGSHSDPVPKVVKPETEPAASLSLDSTDSFEKYILQIQKCNGSKQAIKAIFKELQAAGLKNSTLMDMATTLAKNGDTVKASHLFFHIQADPKITPEERTALMKAMSLAFFAYGIKHNDPTALDFAIMHGLPEKELHDAKKLLAAQVEGSNALVKAQAELALARLSIFEALHPITDVIDSQEKLTALKAENERVRNAFKQADEIQQLADAGKLPYMTPPGKMVEIEGAGDTHFSLHAQLKGVRKSEKEPVIIFESGLGCISSDWQFVQDALPENIQSISYDRSGMGWSQDDKAPKTVERTLFNLEALLKKLDIKPPYVFVGHSFGGIIGQLFVLRHPDQVQELILVDSGLEDVMPTQSPEGRKEKAADYLPAAVMDFVADERAHEVGDKMALQVHAVCSKTSHLQTYNQEFQHYRETCETLQKELAKGHKLACPLQVIIAGKFTNEERPLTKEEFDLSEKWNEGQAKLLTRSKNSRRIIAKNSDHMIMHHEPEVVASAILSS